MAGPVPGRGCLSREMRMPLSHDGPSVVWLQRRVAVVTEVIVFVLYSVRVRGLAA